MCGLVVVLTGAWVGLGLEQNGLCHVLSMSKRACVQFATNIGRETDPGAISLTFPCINLTRQSKIMSTTQPKARSHKSSNVAWTGPYKARQQFKRLQSCVRCNDRFHAAVERYYILARAWMQACQVQLGIRVQRPDLGWTEPQGTVSLIVNQLERKISK
jgi:hypothetical protein